MNFHNPAPTGYKLERLLVLYPDYASPVLTDPPFLVQLCEIIPCLSECFNPPKSHFNAKNLHFSKYLARKTCYKT